MYNKKKVIGYINSLGGVSVERLISMFKLISAEKLVECVPTGINGLESLDKQMVGSNEDLTEQFLLDAIVLASIEKNKDSEIYVTTQYAYISAMVTKNSGVKRVTLEEMRNHVYGGVSVLESHKEKYQGNNEEGESKEENDKEEKVKEEPKQEEQEKDSKEEKPKQTESDKKLLEYYSAHYNGAVSELLKRYNSLFASGYEVSKPYGLLSENGVMSLSGNELVYKDNTASTSKMYRICKDILGFKEVNVRSGKNIFMEICREFSTGSGIPLYFPKKLLEFVYGRTPSGLGAESEKTYLPHDKANSWSSYSSAELKNSLKSLAEGMILWYLHSCLKENESPTDDTTVVKIEQLLTYFQKCMSMCLLLIDWKVVGGIPSIFRLRLCDPDMRVKEDLTGIFIKEAFMGSTGEVPFSYQPRIEEDTYIKEYAHEFNHDISQAMPLFAYKAYDVLKAQGIAISWDNIVLGKFEDGSILRNGTHGVDLKNNLTHHIDAGSRAGKGVMTLAILGAGIASKKNIFYLDRKPDMASMMKHLSPNMFVVNGAEYVASHDNYGVYASQNSWVRKDLIPNELEEIMQSSLSWDTYGDMFYMRALKLVMGIIIARGSGKQSDAKFGGKNGILLVVDEFKNFQESFAKIIDKMFKFVAPDKNWYRKELDRASNKGEDTSYLKGYYNTTSLYAVSYLNHLIEDLEYLSSKRDAGFASKEVELSDIFVIGQNLVHGMLPFEKYRNVLTTGRYRSMNIGTPSSSLDKLDTSTQSFGYSMVSFKTADAFFGRNQEDGRDKYLAQKNKNSKAYGRLDDKASNFAYMRSFNESIRHIILGGNVNENIRLANDCIYFKPFLVLNDCTPQFTGPMFDRCRGTEEVPYVTKEEVIAENPDSQDSSRLSRNVGFENYLINMGVTDYSSVLESGAHIADYVVKELLGYPGNWFDFIIDLRPEWMFTIEDIVNSATGGIVKLKNPLKNPVLREYYEYVNANKGSDVNEQALDNVSDFYYDGGNSEDFSNMNAQDKSVDERLAEALGDNEIIGEDEEVALWDDMSDNIQEIDPRDEVNLQESSIQETRTQGSNSNTDIDVDSIINSHIEALRKLGIDVPIKDDSWKAVNPITGSVEPEGFKSAPDTEFGEDLGNIDYSEDINSYEDMVKIISKDLVNKFGGLERIHSFKVVGGSIIINRYYYRCKVKDMFARNIPYDIRREINAGSISNLFDYRLLQKMPNIRDLEFDSVSFVYDYVSGPLGFGNSINVYRFFEGFRKLQVLTIGKERFTRSNYMEKSRGEDLFYSPKTARIYADAVELALGNANKRAWSWTKRSASNKNVKFWKKAGLVSLGVTASAASYVGTKAVNTGKKLPNLAKGIYQSFKEFIE